eukprot:3727006-Rhodomonas_salina.3
MSWPPEHYKTGRIFVPLPTFSRKSTSISRNPTPIAKSRARKCCVPSPPLHAMLRQPFCRVLLHAQLLAECCLHRRVCLSPQVKPFAGFRILLQCSEDPRDAVVLQEERVRVSVREDFAIFKSCNIGAS